MQTVLGVILLAFAGAIEFALIAAVLRPRRENDLPRALIEAPRFPRGGYAAMSDEPWRARDQ